MRLATAVSKAYESRGANCYDISGNSDFEVRLIQPSFSGCREINILGVKKTFSICDVFVNVIIIALFSKINLHFVIKSTTLKTKIIFITIKTKKLDSGSVQN